MITDGQMNEIAREILATYEKHTGAHSKEEAMNVTVRDLLDRGVIAAPEPEKRYVVAVAPTTGREGATVCAVRAIRDVFGCGIGEAKRAIDSERVGEIGSRDETTRLCARLNTAYAAVGETASPWRPFSVTEAT